MSCNLKNNDDFLYLHKKRKGNIQKGHKILKYQNKTFKTVKQASCLLFRVLLVLLELLDSPDQEEDLDPRDPREPLDREVSL